MKLLLLIILVVAFEFARELKAQETGASTEGRATQGTNSKNKSSGPVDADVYKKGDVNGGPVLGAASTSPRGDKLDSALERCKDGNCAKTELSSSRRSDGNCALGSNQFEPVCKDGASLDNLQDEGKPQNQ